MVEKNEEHPLRELLAKISMFHWQLEYELMFSCG